MPIISENTKQGFQSLSSTISWKSIAPKYKVPLFIFLLIFLSLPVSLFTMSQETRTRSKADTTSIKPVNLILYLTKDRETGKVTIEKATAYNNNKIPYIPPNKMDTQQIEQNLNGKTLSTTKFHFNSEMLGLPPRPGEKYGDPPHKLAKPEAVLSLRYMPNAQLSIRNLQTQEHQPLNMSLVNIALLQVKDVTNPESNQAPLSTSADNYLDILYISSHYTDYNLFHSDVDAMGNFLQSITPYTEYAQNIRIQTYDNPEELGCTYYGRCISCNAGRVYDAAAKSGLPYDTIMVVENNNNYGGCADFGGYATTYRDVAADAKQLMVHELSHSLGYLWDEYSYGYDGPPDEDPEVINCDESSSCVDWSGIPGTSCNLGCTYNNWYKPTSRSCMMETLSSSDGLHYDPVDEPSIRYTLNEYSPIPPGTPYSEDPNYLWTTNWCVDSVKSCVNSDVINPAYKFDLVNYCLDDTLPYTCSGYKYSPISITPTDNPSLTNTPTPSLTPTPTPGITNGGFDIYTGTDGIPDFWTKKNLITGRDRRVTTESHGGIASFRMTTLASGDPIKSLIQPIAKYKVPKGTTFTLSGWNKLPNNLTSGFIKITVLAVNNSNEKTTKTNYEITFPTASHGWQKQQKDFILNQDADSLTLKVKYSGVGPRTFFDAIRWDSPALSTTYSSSTPPDSDD